MLLTEFAESGELLAIYGTVKPTTVGAYNRAWILRIRPSLGSYELAALSPSVIERAWHGWTGARSTKQDAVAVLSRLLRRARREGLIDNNPCLDLELPRAVHADPTSKALNAREVERLLAVAPPLAQLPLALMAYCGLRFSEMAGLRWSDIDDSVLVVRQQITRGQHGERRIAPPKSGRSRAVPVPKQLAVLIEAAKDSTRSELVAPCPSGTGWNSSNFTRDIGWRELRERIRPGLRFHDLRHTAITLWFEAGISANDIQALAGHSSLQVTSLYSTARRDAASRAASALTDFLDS